MNTSHSRYALVLFALGLILLAAAPAGAVVIYETVAPSGDQGQYATIAVDEDRTPHIAWYDASNGRLDYAYRDFSGWHQTMVDSGNRGWYASLAINPANGYPSIAYYDQDAERPKYAWFDGSLWHTEYISTSDSKNGDYISLAFRDDGVPFVSYHFDDGAFNDMGVKVAWRIAADNWDDVALDSTIWTGIYEFGQHTAIAFSSADQPQIAYRDDALGDQKFGWLDGGGWHIQTAIDIFPDSLGEFPSIAVDIGDNIYVSSWMTPLIGDSCVSLASKVSGIWDLEDIACGPDDFGKYSSVAVDSTGHLRLAFWGDNALQYAVEEDDAWTIAVLDAYADPSRSTGEFNDLALDDRDTPYIVYYDAYAKDVRFVFELDPPEVDSITPNSAYNDATLDDVAITGDLFEATSTVRLYNAATKAQVAATDVSVTSPQNLTCDFDLIGAMPGTYNVEVTNQAGAGELVGGFSIVTYPPELTSIDPTTAENDDSAVTIEITGAHLVADMNVRLTKQGEQDRVADEVTVDSPTGAEAVFNLVNAMIGDWNLEIETPYGDDQLDDALEITCGQPVANFNGLPKQGDAPLEVQFADQSVDFAGCQIDSWSWVFGDGATSTEQNPEHIYAEPGEYTVALTVTSPGGEDSVSKNNFIVVTEPADDDDDNDDNDDNNDDNDDNNDDVVPDDDDTSPREDENNQADDGCGC